MASFSTFGLIYRFNIFLVLNFCCTALYHANGQNPFHLYLTEDSKSFSQSAQQITDQFNQFNEIYRSPVKRLEFRTETHDFKLNQQEYSLRLSFNDFLYNNYNRQILSNELMLVNAETKNIKNKALENKYRDILEYLLVSEELKIQLSKLESTKALDEIYQLLIKNGQIEIDDVTSNQLESLKIQASIFSLKEQINNFSKLFWQQDSIYPIEQSLPEPKDIIQFIDSSKSLSDDLDQINLIKEELLHIKYKQKSASENQLLDFLQARYIADPEDLINEKLSIGIGLRIPYINNNSFNKSKLHQSLLELRHEQGLKLLDLDWDLQKIKRNLKSKYVQFTALDNGLKNLTQMTQPVGFAEMKITDGIKWFKRKLEIDKFKLSILDLKKDYYKEYINFLSKSAYINIDYPYYLLHLPFSRI